MHVPLVIKTSPGRTPTYRNAGVWLALLIGVYFTAVHSQQVDFTCLQEEFSYIYGSKSPLEVCITGTSRSVTFRGVCIVYSNGSKTDHYSSGISITDEGVRICAKVTDDIVPVETNTLEVAFDVQPDGSPSVKCHVVIEGREELTVDIQFDGCSRGKDDVWNIPWSNTERGESDTKSCPGRNTTGIAERRCGSDGNWEDPPNVLKCHSSQFANIEHQIVNLATNPAPEELLTDIITELTAATRSADEISLLPLDLNTTNSVISSILDVTEKMNMTVNETLIAVFDNVLEETNSNGWQGLQMIGAGSQALLDNIEHYGLLLASSVNGTDKILSNPNIVVRASQYDLGSNRSVAFPQEIDLDNFTMKYQDGMSPARVEITADFVQEIADEEISTSTVPVVNILFRNLVDFLPISTHGLGSETRGVSEVISVQVGNERRPPPLSPALMNNTANFIFTFDSVKGASKHTCVYWNFSNPVGNGHWASVGVQTVKVTTEANITTVQCESSHLTSFAVLVDVAGGQQGISSAEAEALKTVSYVGCAISAVSLLITVVVLFMLGKDLLVAVHNFIHLNLAIALLLGYLLFLGGIETAAGNTVACALVAALLQYFFLAAFCWMLCEGIYLFLILVVVFSTLPKKWWLFLLIGWVPPVPIVAIGVGVRREYYGVEIEGTLQYCWLSPEKGSIWGFVAPMLLIIMVNVVFLALVLRVLLRSKKNERAQEKEDVLELARTLVRGALILLPLLGVTWVFGVLTLDTNTTVFAWIFTFFNSLQGLAILILHVLRNNKVRSKIGPKLSKLREKVLSSAVTVGMSTSEK